MRHPKSPWTPELDARLTKLWPDISLSCSVIGTKLGLTKNAIIGRSRRIGLPPRPTVSFAVWTDDQVVRAKAMVRNGGSYYKAGAAVGFDDRTVRRRAERENWAGKAQAATGKAPAFKFGVFESPPAVAQNNRRPPRVDSNSGHYSASQDTSCRYIQNDDLRAPNYCTNERLLGKAWCLKCFNLVYQRAPAKLSA